MFEPCQKRRSHLAPAAAGKPHFRIGKHQNSKPARDEIQAPSQLLTLPSSLGERNLQYPRLPTANAYSLEYFTHFSLCRSQLHLDATFLSAKKDTDVHFVVITEVETLQHPLVRTSDSSKPVLRIRHSLIERVPFYQEDVRSVENWEAFVADLAADLRQCWLAGGLWLENF